MVKLAIFASGSGTNAEALIRFFGDNETARVAKVIYNRKDAYVAVRAKSLGVEAKYVPTKDIDSSELIDDLSETDFIILAGFLSKIPSTLVKEFQDRMINIHPALLPAYGGKGMYGQHVHDAVLKNKEKRSGITIHLVNENYDEGTILFQASCAIVSEDTPESLASKIHRLEHFYFPRITLDYIQEFQSQNRL